jgi:membrane protease YdiL (CAAX protease family)
VPPAQQSWDPPAVQTTWAPSQPPGWTPPAASGQPVANRPEDGRLLGGRAAALVAIAIGLGGIVQLVALALSHRSGIEPDTLIRYDLVLTLVLYAVVATMVVSQITPSIRLRWGDGPLAGRIGFGALVGCGLSLILLLLVSAGSGHVAPDPRIVLLMSEGDATHILMTVFISCVAAPLVEETLFRGLLLESLRPRGLWVALIVSAVAFAAWHLMPAALIYYSAMGLALGWLYVKRGLAASMAAHAGFNGVLVIAAITVVLGPSHRINLQGLTLTEPSGWSQVTLPAYVTDMSTLRGPDGSFIDILAGEPGRIVDPAAVAGDLRANRLPFDATTTIDQKTVREITLPIGTADEVDITFEGRAGEMVIFPAADRTYGVIFMNAGSEKAKSDFTTILSSLHA